MINGIYKHEAIKRMDRWGIGTVDDFAAEILGITDKSRLPYYQKLTEENVGTAYARRLPDLIRHLERQRGFVTEPQCPDDWAKLSTLIAASEQTAAVLERDPDLVFQHLATQDPQRDDQDIVARYFTMRSRQGNFQMVEDIQTWKNRIAASILASKIMNTARRHGFNIPVRHAFFMASGGDLLTRNDIDSIPRPIRKTILAMRDDRHLINAILTGLQTNRALDIAFDYATHRSDWDAALRELIITNRLDEHGAGFEWPRLPSVMVEDGKYTIIPMERQSDLLKDARRVDHELWRQGQDAILDGAHFVSLRKKGGIAIATAKIQEPESPDGAWRVDQVATKDHNLHNMAGEFFEQYIQSPAFLAQVNTANFENIRHNLRLRLGRMATHGHA